MPRCSLYVTVPPIAEVPRTGPCKVQVLRTPPPVHSPGPPLAVGVASQVPDFAVPITSARQGGGGVVVAAVSDRPAEAELGLDHLREKARAKPVAPRCDVTHVSIPCMCCQLRRPPAATGGSPRFAPSASAMSDKNLRAEAGKSQHVTWGIAIKTRS